METIERLYTDKIRVWDIYLNDAHIGVVKFNKESENISFKMRSNYTWGPINYVTKAMDIVKSQIIDEVLLENL